MKMTREKFLAGAIFQVPGVKYTRYQYIADANPGKDHKGYLREINGSRFQFSEHHSNVTEISKIRFRTFTVLLGRCYYAYCYFENLILIDEPKPNCNEQDN